jgi:hypothetical protein
MLSSTQTQKAERHLALADRVFEEDAHGAEFPRPLDGGRLRLRQAAVLQGKV